jgi:hypothetical protein
MSDPAGEHHDPHRTQVSETNNNTGRKLANCKNAGGVGEKSVTSFSHISEKD